MGLHDKSCGLAIARNPSGKVAKGKREGERLLVFFNDGFPSPCLIAVHAQKRKKEPCVIESTENKIYRSPSLPPPLPPPHPALPACLYPPSKFLAVF